MYRVGHRRSVEHCAGMAWVRCMRLIGRTGDIVRQRGCKAMLQTCVHDPVLQSKPLRKHQRRCHQNGKQDAMCAGEWTMHIDRIT